MKNESLLITDPVLLLLNFIAGFFFNKEGTLFGDMFHTNPLIAFQKNILNLGVYLISLLFADWLKKHEHLPEFFMLMLSALLGMFFMISSGNLLMFYLSLELATIPVAAMANFDLEKKRSSEGSHENDPVICFFIRYFIIWYFTDVWCYRNDQFCRNSEQLGWKPLQILAFVFLFTAFAFKLSIVPFHLWTADVYEGSPIAVTSFLSVISKGSIAFIFITALYKVFQPMQEVWYNMLVILVYCHDDHWKPVCTAATKYQTIPCIFIHCTGRFYFGGYQQ